MSDYGARFWGADGQVLFDLTKQAGVVVDAFHLPEATPTGSKQYTRFRWPAELHWQRIYDLGQSSSYLDYLHSIWADKGTLGAWLGWNKRSSPGKSSYVIAYATGDYAPTVTADEHGFMAVSPGNGHLIVSDQTYNMCYRGRATYKSGSREYVGADRIWAYTRRTWFLTYEITNCGPQAEPPLAFVESANAGNDHFGVWSYKYMGSGKWEIVVTYHSTQSTNDTPGPIPKVLVFDRFRSAPSGWGMAVWDQSGNVCFHTGEKPLIIEGTVSILPGTHRDEVRSATYSGGLPARPAFMFASNAILSTGQYSYTNSQVYTLFCIRAAGIHPTSNGIECRWCRVAGGGSDSWFRNRDTLFVPMINAALYD